MDRSDLSRWWGRTMATLGLSALPPGYRAPPGASTARMLFAVLWLVLGVIQTAIFLRSPGWLYGGLAVAWFLLGARDIGRARLLLQAEARRRDED
jgi:hypothetical protein